jgi:hypothetical protein
MDQVADVTFLSVDNEILIETMDAVMNEIADMSWASDCNAELAFNDDVSIYTQHKKRKQRLTDFFLSKGFETNVQYTLE